MPAGVAWYRTRFSLNLPPGQYVPIIYVNGWLIGRYVNNVGPQHQFYVPAGILNDQGQNTIAIADWGLDSTTGGPSHRRWERSARSRRDRRPR